MGKDYDVFARREIRIEAGEEIRLICGRSLITLSSDGTVRVNGKKIFNVANDLVELLADEVKIN